MRDLLAEARGDWRHLVHLAGEGDQRCQAFLPFLERMCEHPEKLRAFPVFSMWELMLSRCPEYPFDYTDLPLVSLSEDGQQFCLNEEPCNSLDDLLERLLPLLSEVQPYLRPLEDE